MKRRQWLSSALTFGWGAVFARGGPLFAADPAAAKERPATAPAAAGAPITPPAKGPIAVAFLISEGANVIDTAGPWEVFQDTMVPGPGDSREVRMPFRLFTVADRPGPVRMSGGLRVTPDYALADLPQPRVIVVPAMQGTERTLEWLKSASARADVTLSVCTGAYELARAGLLDGLAATTHHEFWDDFASTFPRVRLLRGPRFVESSPRIATAGGLTSGIDLALRVVERYFGRPVAETSARYLEHEGRAWQASEARPSS